MQTKLDSENTREVAQLRKQVTRGGFSVAKGDHWLDRLPNMRHLQESPL